MFRNTVRKLHDIPQGDQRADASSSRRDPRVHGQLHLRPDRPRRQRREIFVQASRRQRLASRPPQLPTPAEPAVGQQHPLDIRVAARRAADHLHLRTNQHALRLCASSCGRKYLNFIFIYFLYLFSIGCISVSTYPYLCSCCIRSAGRAFSFRCFRNRSSRFAVLQCPSVRIARI
jgi:hypothetical protein